MLPNFLVIGAAKAGTTSLYDWLRQHPDVFMPAFKEPKFFAWDGEGGREGGGPVVQVTDRAAYEALFDAAGGARAVGEASTIYLAHPRAPERVASAIPAARLIASLRDPVERAFSVYQMNLRLFGANEGRGFAEALRADPALRQGYQPGLARWRERFGDRLSVILFEDLARDPAGTMRGLFAHLGVDPGFAPDVSKAANPGGLPRSRRLHRLLTDPRIRAVGRGLLPPAAIDRLRGLRSRNLERQALAPGERAAAIAVFRDDILRTQDLIGRDLAVWLRA